MYTKDDLFKIFDYLNGNTNDLPEQLKTIASSQLGSTQVLFENTLDQIAFSSADYRRLRSFLIKWYSAHRTITSQQQDASTVFFLPETHLHELMRSFGFPYGNVFQEFRTKANFFLELVDLYKIKGSKQAIVNILNYFNIPSSYLIEYFLVKNGEGNYVFRQQLAQEVDPVIRRRINLKDVNFESIINLDPHWFQSKSDIDKLFQENKINLPSKTPYFSVRTSFEYNTIEPIPLYFFRILTNYYNQWRDDGTLPPRDINAEQLKRTVNILELYTALTYVGNKYFHLTHTNGPKIRTYTKDKSYDEYLKDFNVQFNIPPLSIKETENLRDEWRDKFTDDTNKYPFVNYGDASDILEDLNPDIKDLIDTWDRDQQLQNLALLTADFSRWLRDNIDPETKEIGIYAFGWKAFETIDINALLNFFKPYRTKFILTDLEYIMNRPLFESVRYDEYVQQNIDETIVDFGTADGEPCEDDTGPRETYDCGSSYDVGIVRSDYMVIDSTNEIAVDFFYGKENRDNPENYIDSSINRGLFTHSLSGGKIVATQDVGFFNFDEGVNFDDPKTNFGNEVVTIISEVI